MAIIRPTQQENGTTSNYWVISRFEYLAGVSRVKGYIVGYMSEEIFLREVDGAPYKLYVPGHAVEFEIEVPKSIFNTVGVIDFIEDKIRTEVPFFAEQEPVTP